MDDDRRAGPYRRTPSKTADADIDAGVAIAATHNRFGPDLSAITEVDRIVIHSFPDIRGSE